MFNKSVIVKNRKSICIFNSDYDKLRRIADKLSKHNISLALQHVIDKVNCNLIDYNISKNDEMTMIVIESELHQLLMQIKITKKIKTIAIVVSSILNGYKEI